MQRTNSEIEEHRATSSCRTRTPISRPDSGAASGMRPDTATEDDLAPLVLELARALRARRVHPSGHPVVADSIRRATALWRVLVEGSGELRFAVRGVVLARGGVA